MERLSTSISNKVAAELKLDKDSRDVIAYGAFAILQILLSTALVIIFGYLFNVVVEALIITFTVSTLRKYSGGFHSSSPSICVIAGTIICMALSKTALKLSTLANCEFMLILGFITFLIAYLIIYKLAPVDSAAKPIKKLEKRKRMKKDSMLILSAYFIIAIINIILYLYLGYKKLLIYSICMHIGILWQIFTLTNLGHMVLRKVDAFFIYYLFRREDHK